MKKNDKLKYKHCFYFNKNVVIVTLVNIYFVSGIVKVVYLCSLLESSPQPFWEGNVIFPLHRWSCEAQEGSVVSPAYPASGWWS